MCSYSEKIQNLKIEDFYLEQISAEESPWVVDIDESMSFEEYMKIALNHYESENVNIVFTYYLDDEVSEPSVSIVIHLDHDKVFAGYSIWYNTIDAFDEVYSIDDIPEVDYNGFKFHDVDKCIEKGIASIKENVDYSKL